MPFEVRDLTDGTLVGLSNPHATYAEAEAALAKHVKRWARVDRAPHNYEIKEVAR